MWKLKSLRAKNICAFKELEYNVLQGHTTLIFGNNMDNDSQGSNGSGKSAMLEVIAIGLTGEPLRKIRMEEIINDAEDTAVVGLLLYNTFSRKYLNIERVLSRKSPQVVTLKSYDTDGSNEEIITEATVADYHRWMLDTIGLTKDDIYTNFILSKHKYSSFLASSDKEKKEIINRFSNGVIVDESIAALHEDMVPVHEQLNEAEKVVANYSGRVTAIQDQIDSAINESTERSQKKVERLKSWEEAIVNKRTFIREQNGIINNANDTLDQYDKVEAELQELENSDKTIVMVTKLINKRYAELKFQLPRDFVALTNQNAERLKEITKEYNAITKNANQTEAKIETMKKAHEKLIARHQQFQEGYNKKYTKITDKINKLLDAIKKLENENIGLKNQRIALENSIAALQHQLAGVIECPQCHHEFTLGNNINIVETKAKLQDCEGEVKDIAATIEQNQKDIADYTEQGRGVRTEQNELITNKSEWSTKITNSQTELDTMMRKLSETNNSLQNILEDIEGLKKAIKNNRRNLFDDAYAILDDAIQKQEDAIKQAEIAISNAEGSIKSYEESIADIEKSSETDVIESLKESKTKYEKELASAIVNKETIEQELATYKLQENTFIEFKTHLANSKIDALSQITNEFLEAIGSDIRISFSGYTILKSGKIRDKISISLIRDGVDCGSFDKFSEGEKTRVNLANILAMHKLTNVNCDEGKGLDLLVLDEILEATDEQGLSKIFDALNQLQITSLVVSHGNIAESYPYKTVINKLNGISYING